MDLLRVLAAILLGASALALLYWLIMLGRIARAVAAVPTVRAGLREPAPPEGRPRVSVIVPAHNEERVIETCAASLRAQDYPALEIIFVLDRCTDRTRAILEPHARDDDRIQLIENDQCPPDWAGKCHAAHLGAARARGDWLLFTDADTRFDPALVRAAVGLAMARHLDLLSLLGTLTTERGFERVVQPVAAAALMRLYPLERANRAQSPRLFANGQFMLFQREAYERLGGHVAVKNDLLEDIAFARRLQEAGGRGGIVLADGMLVVSMYDTFAAFRNGWKRIFIEACKRKTSRLRKNAWRLLIMGAGLPILQLAAIAVAAALDARGAIVWLPVIVAVVAAGWMAQAAALAWMNRLGGAPLRGILLYPLGCWVVARIMLEGARDLAIGRPQRWAGREYIIKPR
jgi:glycosyltransferase involved in cell wall biosynthesis